MPKSIPESFLIHSHGHDGAAEESLNFHPIHLPRIVSTSAKFHPLVPVDLLARVWSDSHGEVVLDAWRHGSHELQKHHQVLINTNSW